MEFFLRYMIEITFLSTLIHWTVLALSSGPRSRQTLNFIENQRQILDAQMNRLRFKDWYFNLDYSIAFTMSVFVLALIFSACMPLILIFAALFFFLKFITDFYNLIFVQEFHMLKPKQGTARKSLFVYMYVSITLFFVFTLIFMTASDQLEIHAVVTLVGLIISVLLLIYFSVSKYKSDAAKKAVQEAPPSYFRDPEFLLKVSDTYLHPLEKKYPSIKSPDP